jgi:hypothetical protein
MASSPSLLRLCPLTHGTRFQTHNHVVFSTIQSQSESLDSMTPSCCLPHAECNADVELTLFCLQDIGQRTSTEASTPCPALSRSALEEC